MLLQALRTDWRTGGSETREGVVEWYSKRWWSLNGQEQSPGVRLEHIQR